MSLNYTGMRRIRDKAARERCAKRLLQMRATLEPLHSRKSDSKLLLATWNIRDFDGNKFKWGPRLPETFYYLAEMMSCFDLIAVQEVNRDLEPLQKLVGILGREWDYIVTDTTEGWSGNSERLAFVYNTEKVWFRKMAGEVVLPSGQLIVTKKLADTEDGQKILHEVGNQFARTPYTVAFQSGWFKFNLCTVHIYYGSASGAKLKRRIDEISKLMAFFRKRQDKENRGLKNRPEQAENYILLGDFNVVSPEHKTMEALESNGFRVPDEIGGDIVRLDHGKYYDQIALRVKDERFRVLGGGVVNMFADVFRDTDEDREVWASMIPDDLEPDQPLEKRYAKWRTWQMSDHSPLWIEIDTEYANHYLGKIAEPGT